jgi:L-iditol 2-dehydrogenase
MVLTGSKQMELREVDVPRVAPDGLLLAVEAAAICNATDYRIFSADDPTQVWPCHPWPTVMGHEFCGRVVEAGADVEGWAEGDRLSGWCHDAGAFAEYCHVVPSQLATIRVPEEWPAEEAAMLEPVIGTLRYLITPDGFVMGDGARILAAGLGPAGLLYVQHARLLGARDIWAMDRNAPRREIAEALGATRTFDGIDSVERAFAEASEPFDGIIDTTGADLREPFLRMLVPGGFLVPFGVGYDWANAGLAENGVRICGGGTDEARLAVPHVMRWIAEGGLRLGPMVSRRIGLEGIPAAMEALQERPKRLVKIVAVPGLA